MSIPASITRRAVRDVIAEAQRDALRHVQEGLSRRGGSVTVDLEGADLFEWLVELNEPDTFPPGLFTLMIGGDDEEAVAFLNDVYHDAYYDAVVPLVDRLAVTS